MAYHLLKSKEPEDTNTHKIDVLKQVDSMEVTFQREGMQATMLKRNCIPGLNQKRILCFSNSTEQRMNSNSSETKSNGKWKCIPRKKTLIRNPEQILYPSDLNTSNEKMFFLFSVKDASLPPIIDWSCNDMIVIRNITEKFVRIYNNNGSVRAVQEGDNGKWSNDGSKLAISEYDSCNSSARLMLYDVEKGKKLWTVTCKYIDRRNTTATDFRSLECITWSHHDSYVIVACEAYLLIYAADTGELFHSIHIHEVIVFVSFSPNFKYLILTYLYNDCEVYSWPELTTHFYIRCNYIKAIAWHPLEPHLVCLGKNNGSLTLWNVSTKTREGYVSPKLKNSCVENLAWNKLSGELLVEWNYKERRNGDGVPTIISVLASFDRVVDVLPVDRKASISFMQFNSTHEKLITFYNDVFSIWNFFGNDKPPQSRYLPLYSSRQSRQGIIIHNQIR